MVMAMASIKTIIIRIGILLVGFPSWITRSNGLQEISDVPGSEP
jgi:hypothetical protein